MAKSTKPKFGQVRSATRRDELRRNLPKPGRELWSLVQRPEVLSAGGLLLVFAVVIALIISWSRDQILVAAGQVMTETRLNRIDFAVPDNERTTELEREARLRAPQVYAQDTDFLTSLRNPLHQLPVLVAKETDFESITASIREMFGLDEASYSLLTLYAQADGTASTRWTEWVDTLIDEVLPRYALLEMDSAEWQRRAVLPQQPHLRGPDGTIAASWNDAITLVVPEGEDARGKLRSALHDIVVEAGFRTDVARYVAARLAFNVRPTYVWDQAATIKLADAEADAVDTVMIPHAKGSYIYRRGDALLDEQLSTLRLEAAHWRVHAPPGEIWLPRLGVLGVIAVLMMFVGGFVMRSYPRILRNRLRISALGLLMTGMLALPVIVSSQVPELLFPAAVGSTLFAAIVLLLAYDQRLALFLGAVQCAIVSLALVPGVAWFIVLMVGCGTMVSQLRQVRHRSSLIHAAIVTAATLGVGTILLGLLVTPAVEGVWVQVLTRAAWAIAASIIVGFLVLGILPSIERLFDITTGMTLAELRDPSQPLLRQLQQRAPGTYNHSLQVANIAEAAAESIGADSLLVYVGALYHDIGKMNKPEYFIENQAGGFNKHSRLRPAMSLLVIIGHVKDGIELAREYGLPRPLQHFIEGHHGTTLVEYFYHAAKTEAQAEKKASVDEVEFRYPGPRPQTKEVAVLMLADAVESAARTMTEPNPGRIESLVRELSRKRLLDGQFDECDLTFRELGLIEEAVTARLCAIHHGRISYPSAKAEEAADPAAEAAG